MSIWDSFIILSILFMQMMKMQQLWRVAVFTCKELRPQTQTQGDDLKQELKSDL